MLAAQLVIHLGIHQAQALDDDTFVLLFIASCIATVAAHVGYPSQRTSTTEGGNCNCRLIYMLKTEIYLIYVTPHPTIHISHHDYQEYVDGPLVAADLLF